MRSSAFGVGWGAGASARLNESGRPRRSRRSASRPRSGSERSVPTAVTGWFGQNLPYWGFSEPWGLWQSIVLIVVGTVGLYWLFRRNDWL